jgi:hypothetical protein
MALHPRLGAGAGAGALHPELLISVMSLAV